MKIEGGTCAIELNKMAIAWDLDEGTAALFGRPAALFWLNPSLFWMLSPLVDEVGAPLFRLLVASESAAGADEDYALIAAPNGTFEEGFRVWGRAASAAGWGTFALPVFDRVSRCAVVQVRNPWELRMQQGSAAPWGCPFLLGKVMGIFSRTFGVNCWADESSSPIEGESSKVEIRVYASEKTIAVELARLRRERAEEARRPLESAERALSEKEVLIERQEGAIRAMATPILEVWDGILALPIVGIVDSRRAAEITESLLGAVSRSGARFALLDLTGVDLIDTATACHFDQIFRAISLLGAECLVCGIRPAVAQAMVALGGWSGRARTFGTMRGALRAAMAGAAGAV